MWGGVGCCARENSEDAAGVGLGRVGVDLAVALATTPPARRKQQHAGFCAGVSRD